MDGARFDQLSKTLVIQANRRRVLQGVSGLVAALLSTMTAEATTEARRGRVRKQARAKGPDPCAVFCADQPKARGAQCRQVCKSCPAGPAGLCFNAATGAFTCHDFANDPSNCGGCGTICPQGTICHEGGCCVENGQVCSGTPLLACCGAPDFTCELGSTNFFCLRCVEESDGSRTCSPD